MIRSTGLGCARYVHCVWNRYWFADGGRLAVAVVRIAIALAVIATLVRLAGPTSAGDVPGEHTLYRPVGIWMVLGHAPPPGWLVDALWFFASWGSLGMLLGL